MGYQHNGNHLDSHSKLAYPLGPVLKVDDLKLRRHDTAQNYPVSLLGNYHPVRTADNRPAEGVSTAHVYRQIGGNHLVRSAFTYAKEPNADPEIEYSGSDENIVTERDHGSGASSTGKAIFIRPGRSHIDYQIMMSERIQCNSCTWYTNGSSQHPGQNMPTYAPELLDDLIECLRAYEARRVTNNWDSAYQDRNMYVTYGEQREAD